MLNVILAGGHLYGKQLFTRLSLVVSLMASFVLSFFPLDVLDEIWDLTESVSEGFLTYSLGWYRHSVWGPSYRRAIKEVSKVVNLDWVNNQACSLSLNIYVIKVLYIKVVCDIIIF